MDASSSSAAAVLTALVLGACVAPPDSVAPDPDPDPDTEPEPEPRCDPIDARASCAREPDGFACRWGRNYERRSDAEAIAAAVGGPADIDAALRRLFPVIGDKPIADRPPLPTAPLSISLVSYPAYETGFPIDWEADPYGNRSWRFYFQNLHWLSRHYDAGGIETAARVVLDWVDGALYSEPALEHTWTDNAISRRLTRVLGFVDAYAAHADSLDRRVLRAAAEITLTHVYALSTPACYADNNHGLMQDLALLQGLPELPALIDWEALWSNAEARTTSHVVRSIAADGMHVENSPAYHLIYLRLLLAAIDAIADADRDVSPKLERAREQMFGVLAHMLQPNLTFPQFGDTSNGAVSGSVLELIAKARRQGLETGVLGEIEAVIEGSDPAAMPAALDRVFAASGYAAFRSRWGGPDPAAAISAHVTCGRLSPTHYHADEGSFEIYGHGTELISDTGKYSYDYDHPMVAHQYAQRAHNVLVIDDVAYEPTGDAGVVDHGSAADLAWVRTFHSHYDPLGVRSQQRTFAFARPDLFAVVDHVVADAPHRYAQHLHLHPSLDDVEVIDSRTVVATTSGGAGPALVLAAAVTPTDIELIRGRQDDRGVQGWHFPKWTVAEPTTDVVFRHAPGAAAVDLPVLVLVVAPGAPIPSVTDATYTARPTGFDLTAIVGGQPRTISVP